MQVFRNTLTALLVALALPAAAQTDNGQNARNVFGGLLANALQQAIEGQSPGPAPPQGSSSQSANDPYSRQNINRRNADDQARRQAQVAKDQAYWDQQNAQFSRDAINQRNAQDAANRKAQADKEQAYWAQQNANQAAAVEAQKRAWEQGQRDAQQRAQAQAQQLAAQRQQDNDRQKAWEQSQQQAAAQGLRDAQQRAQAQAQQLATQIQRDNAQQKAAALAQQQASVQGLRDAQQRAQAQAQQLAAQVQRDSAQQQAATRAQQQASAQGLLDAQQRAQVQAQQASNNYGFGTNSHTQAPAAKAGRTNFSVPANGSVATTPPHAANTTGPANSITPSRPSQPARVVSASAPQTNSSGAAASKPYSAVDYAGAFVQAIPGQGAAVTTGFVQGTVQGVGAAGNSVLTVGRDIQNTETYLIQHPAAAGKAVASATVAEGKSLATVLNHPIVSSQSAIAEVSQAGGQAAKQTYQTVSATLKSSDGNALGRGLGQTVGTTIALDGAGKVAEIAGDAAKGARANGFVQPAGQITSAAKEGIYEFPDQAAEGKPYVGQSSDINSRLAQHEAGGRLIPGTEMTTEVPGGKTTREIAEHARIQQLTEGQTASNSSAVSNKRDPIGPSRRPALGIPEPSQ
jgi:hypothetical protein